MARDDDHLAKVQRTRAGRLWLMLVPALVFLLALVIFIAQNGQDVEVRFLGADGRISLAVALLASALAGAAIVLLVGSVRIVQLRLATRRHRRSELAAGGAPARGVPKPVEAERDADSTGP